MDSALLRTPPPVHLYVSSGLSVILGLQNPQAATFFKKRSPISPKRPLASDKGSPGHDRSPPVLVGGPVTSTEYFEYLNLNIKNEIFCI